MRKVLVTGGAGFIGSYLVDCLARDRDLEIVAADNLYRGLRSNLAQALGNGRVRFVEADTRDAKKMQVLTEGVQVVFHLAAQASVLGAEEDVDYALETNVVGTFNVLRACEQADVQRLVFASSREVYGEAQVLPVAEDAPLAPKNVYGMSKLGGEAYCDLFRRERKLDVAVLRLANVYGPRDFGRVIPIFVENALRGEPLTIYGGRQELDFVWVGDVVAILAEAGLRTESLPEPVNVGSGVGITLQDLAERVLSETGSSSQVQILPPRSVEVERFTADLTRFQTVFRYKPARPLRYLRDVIAYIHSHQVEGEADVAHRESRPTTLAPVPGLNV